MQQRILDERETTTRFVQGRPEFHAASLEAVDRSNKF